MRQQNLLPRTLCFFYLDEGTKLDMSRQGRTPLEAPTGTRNQSQPQRPIQKAHQERKKPGGTTNQCCTPEHLHNNRDTKVNDASGPSKTDGGSTQTLFDLHSYMSCPLERTMLRCLSPAARWRVSASGSPLPCHQKEKAAVHLTSPTKENTETQPPRKRSLEQQEAPSKKIRNPYSRSKSATGRIPPGRIDARTSCGISYGKPRDQSKTDPPLALNCPDGEYWCIHCRFPHDVSSILKEIVNEDRHPGVAVGHEENRFCPVESCREVQCPNCGENYFLEWVNEREYWDRP